MIELNMLRAKIQDSGMTLTAIAKKSGINRETLYNKLNGTSDFKASEIMGISETLRLSNSERDRIFFTK